MDKQQTCAFSPSTPCKDAADTVQNRLRFGCRWPAVFGGHPTTGVTFEKVVGIIVKSKIAMISATLPYRNAVKHDQQDISEAAARTAYRHGELRRSQSPAQAANEIRQL